METSRKISRREFLRVMSIVGGGAVLTACGVKATDIVSPTNAPVSTEAAVLGLTETPGVLKPKYGGILTVNLNRDPPNFDTLSNTTSWVINIMAPCYNSLVMFDPFDPYTIIGDLAKSWEFSEDSKKLTFNLLEGVKFHDGKPFTSADVKYTFDFMCNPPEGEVVAKKALLAAIDNIETPDDYTVVFNLKRPQQSILTVLATGWMLVLPKHILEVKKNMKADVIGTGPFMFKDYTTGVSLELVKNPEYHVAGRPYLDGIKFFLTPEVTTTNAYFKTGDIMLYDELSAEDGRRAEKEYGDMVNILTTPSLTSSGITINCRNKPWDDVRVRQAAAYALDRGQALQILMGNEGTVGGLAPNGKWALPAEELEKLPGYSQDKEANIAEAKRLLTEAGFPNGFAATMLVRQTTPHEARGIFVKDQLAKIGIDVTLNVQETATYTENYTNRNFEISSQGLRVTVNDPDFIYDGWVTGDENLNVAGIFDEEVDALFFQQQTTADEAERIGIAHELEKKAVSNAAYITLGIETKFLGISKRVHNLILHPNPDENRRMQEVWLSEE